MWANHEVCLAIHRLGRALCERTGYEAALGLMRMARPARFHRVKNLEWGLGSRRSDKNVGHNPADLKTFALPFDQHSTSENDRTAES
jgi:hypothetical protein